MESLSRRGVLLASFLLLTLVSSVSSQTWSACNPLIQGSCPADPALGKTVNINFAQGASDSFSASGAPSYGTNGAAFTVARSGDSPTITSKWYIMFGHVEFVLKAAPGTGIVSSAILQSDCLDEIDFEWLGGDDAQVQSNYFGKGQTTTGYNRGAFHGAANNHDQFRTYSIDWTANQIVWSIDGQTVRVLTPSTAQAGQYPQTPMQVKVGIWAGGDPSNAAGTVQWAGGYVDYTAGPYTMYLKSVQVQDYSTGSSYVYSGTAGTWESIKSNGGTVNSGGKYNPSVASQPAVSTATGAPRPFSTSPEQSSIYATRTGFPWVIPNASTTTSKTPVATSYSGLPSGWIITDSGKVVPPSTGYTEYPSTSYWSASASDLPSASAPEVTTTTDSQVGSLTPPTATVPPAPTTSEDSSLAFTSTSTISVISTTLTTSTTSLATSTSSTGFPPDSRTSSVSLPSNPTGSPQAVSAARSVATQLHLVWAVAAWVVTTFVQ